MINSIMRAWDQASLSPSIIEFAKSSEIILGEETTFANK